MRLAGALVSFFVRGRDISAASPSPIGVTFCVMVQLCPGCVFSLFWWRYHQGSPAAGSRKRARVDHFGVSDSDFFCHLTADISKKLSCSVARLSIAVLKLTVWHGRCSPHPGASPIKAKYVAFLSMCCSVNFKAVQWSSW